jgi:hypothetical protein
MAVMALVIFISSLILAASGLLAVAQRDVFGGSLSQAFFGDLTARFNLSMFLFVVGILIAFALLLFSI